ncbi:hypothetical protein BJV78DRAFT_1190228 [Lactifluus subvellereus]|nr:hypothetical protein BJV78DRAFT_1190228 [Lactifluus subvellereus]
MDQSREDIPRISIDSLRDWHRIKANFTKAVFDQFDQRLRQNRLESERASLVPLVQQFIDTTFEKAKLNVRINGKKFEDLKDEDDGTFVAAGDAGGSVSLIEIVGISDREVEPFDEALDRETWSLYNQRLQWDLELATKRRKRPQEVAELLEDLFKVQEAALEELDGPVEEDDDEDRPDASLPDETVLARTSDTFSKVAAISEGLRQTVMTQHERLRRLQDVDEEINALKT